MSAAETDKTMVATSGAVRIAAAVSIGARRRRGADGARQGGARRRR
jgi:hypothetical protein